jgi:hypothetical protein
MGNGHQGQQFTRLDPCIVPYQLNEALYHVGFSHVAQTPFRP